MGTSNLGSCDILTDSNPYSNGRIRRKSRIRLGVPPPPGPPPGGIKAPDGGRLVAKLGLLLERGQSIEDWTLSVPDIGVTSKPVATAAVSSELNHTLPLPWLQWFSHKWVGYLADFGEIVLGGELTSDMTVTFSRSTDKRFQVIPMVFAFAQQPFEAHFILGVTILQAASQETRFDTRISGR